MAAFSSVLFLWFLSSLWFVVDVAGDGVIRASPPCQLVARATHYISAKKNRVCVRVGCVGTISHCREACNSIKRRSTKGCEPTL